MGGWGSAPRMVCCGKVRRYGNVVYGMNPNDYCRFCKKNMRIGGVLAHSSSIFEKLKKPQSTAEKLIHVGVAVVKTPAKSSRMCQRCLRLLSRLERDLPVYRRWVEDEKKNDEASADKRDREPSPPLKKFCPNPASSGRDDIRHSITEHFVDGKPTAPHPHPVDAAIYADVVNPPGALIRKRLCCNLDPSQPVLETTAVTVKIEAQEDFSPKSEPEEQDEESPMADRIRQLEQRNAELLHEMESLKRLVKALQSPLQQTTPEALHYCGIPNYSYFCTGFTYQQFNSLCEVFGVPNTDSSSLPHQNIPLTYKCSDPKIAKMPLRQQLLLVLMKLWQDFDMKDLAYRFQLGVESVCTLFTSWITYMSSTLAQRPTWPHRDVISEHAPLTFKSRFPTTFALLGFAELRTERPNTFLVQSQTWTTDALKSLVAVDPRGAVLYASALFTGPELDVFRQCGVTSLLQTLLERGHLMSGDGLTADERFQLDADVEKLGLKLNIPPCVESQKQMPAFSSRKSAAQHQTHVERVIDKIKTFKIVSGRIPNAMLSNMNDIWFVVSMLSNFQSGHH
ncbi:uncharacterized protein [Pseudorasbora parva]|uniref:uncharacterized protein n=1 Tax=Pseudorasbora parva TaxID=51549 RepID=UPI00351DDA4B